MTRVGDHYQIVPHFKGFAEDGSVVHRQMAVPTPNEALAETALLVECEKHDVFANPENVFSYYLAPPDYRLGAFFHYLPGLRRRQIQIANACRSRQASGGVRYSDIKAFYPSITGEIARRAWDAIARPVLAPAFYQLGERLIEQHVSANVTERAILTGPMFSHLIGNIVLRRLDTEIAPRLPASYFRYVDDLAFVGTDHEIAKSETVVKDWLEENGFELHGPDSPKTIEVSAKEWLTSADDYAETPASRRWARLAQLIKRWLIVNRGEHHKLSEALLLAGFRIPIRDHAVAVEEAGYLERARAWLRRGGKRPTVSRILKLAEGLRSETDADLDRCLALVSVADSFGRKRLVPKLKLLAGRSGFLSTTERMGALKRNLSDVPELALQRRIVDALLKRRIDEVLPLGANAAQSTAQLFRAAQIPAAVGALGTGEASDLGLAIFRLNDVPVTIGSEGGLPSTPLLRLATSPPDSDLMNSESAFVREMACLHGRGEARFSQLVNSAFDFDEQEVADFVELAKGVLS
jgi:hypothetical protein